MKERTWQKAEEDKAKAFAMIEEANEQLAELKIDVIQTDMKKLKKHPIDF